MDQRDRLIVLIGGGGFIGRYAVRHIARTGARLRVAQRDPRQAFYLRPQAAIGQLQFAACDVRKPDTVARAVAGADAVVNLVGVLKGDFQRFHVDGAWHVAQAAAAAGVETLVHVSAIGADPASPSAYGRSKGEGERLVREAFPDATILRPSVVFGPEDGFVNKFAGLNRMLPVVPVIRPGARFQPVYVGDVARAIAHALNAPDEHRGKTYELGGPEPVSMLALNRWVGEATGRRRRLLALPDGLTGALAKATGWLPGAPITHDQWLMLGRDNVANGEGLRQLGIVPTPLEAVADGWLTIYRRQGRFARRGA